MTSSENCPSFKSQQLLARKKLMRVIQELQTHTELGKTEEAASAPQEIDSVDDKLTQLSERKAELQNSQDTILSADQKNNHLKKVKFNTASQKATPLEPVYAIDICYVDGPPSSPAPKVFLETEDLPPYPCRTQCPECRQFIMTETLHSVNSITWIVCFMTALMGCVAGCCLIPFCIDNFKSISHKCPKCRTLIRTIKRL